MSCPVVVDIVTPGPPGVGLPSGVGSAGYAIVKDGNTPYLYKLVELTQLGLPQALGITASPTFAGLTLSGFSAQSSGIVSSGTTGQLSRLAIGTGLSIVNGALVATGSAGTNLSYDSTTRVLSSSTGDDAILPVATTLQDGLMSVADKIKIDSITVNTAERTRQLVRNITGSEITKGSVVRIPSPGSSGAKLLIALADASEEATAANTLGFAEAAIPHNSDGYILTEGELTGINTDHLIEGGLIFLSEITGQMTSTRPVQPAHGVILGWCIKKGPGTSGIIYVKVDNGLELNELHDVLISNPTEGQLLKRSGDLWVNETVDLYSTFSAPTGFTVSGSDTNSITLNFAVGYSLPTTARQGEWDTAYSERLRWDGGNSGLNAATGRASLELGSASTRDAGLTAGNVLLLNESGQVPSAVLPAYVDDVLEFANLAAFPQTGETGKIYVAISPSGKIYRWSGSQYIENNPSPGSTDGLVEGSVNLYFTSTRGQSAASSWWSGYSSTIGKNLAVATDTSAAQIAIGISSTSQVDAETGTSTTPGLWSPARWRQAAVTWFASITSANGRELIGGTYAQMRGLLGLGSAALSAETDFAAASHSQSAATISDSTAVGRSVLTAADQSAARTAIGAGTSSLIVGSTPPSDLAATASAGTSAEAARADHAHRHSPTTLIIPLSGETAPTAKVAVEQFLAPFQFEILEFRLGANTAASVSALIVDLNVNGVSICTTRSQINVGATTSNVATLSTTSVASGASVTIDIDQAGGGGSLLKGYLTFRRTG